MHTKQPLFEAYPILTGGATIVADDALTLLSATDSLYALFNRQNMGQGKASTSLFALIPFGLATQIHAMLEQGTAQCQCQLSWKNPEIVEYAEPLAQSEEGVTHMEVCATRLEEVPPVQGKYVYHLVFTDVSAFAQLHQVAVLEKQRFDILFDITEDIAFEYYFATDTMFFAERYQTIVGKSPVIKGFRERLGKGESIDEVSDLFRFHFMNMSATSENAPECRVSVGNGNYRWFSLLCTQILDEQGRPVKAVGAIRNIDKQKCEQLRLLNKSRIDAMTGLLNKGTTEEEIAGSLGDVGPDSMGALMMLDIDNFKTVNDNLGHLAGDAVIVQFAKQLTSVFRREDIIGRVGGDEFHIFMSGIKDISIVYSKAREICSSVRSLFAKSDLDNKVSVSVGIACVDKPLPYSELFRQADVALYRAKANGKNRYEVFGRPSSNEKEQVYAKAVPLATRMARNSIVVDIVETLFSVRDMRKGIDKTLQFIGNALRVSGLLIYEKSLDLKTISITHEWVAQSEWSAKAKCQNMPVEAVDLPRPIIPGGIYYCSDLQSLAPEKRTFVKDSSITSLLQCDIVREGMVVGQISFEERGKKRFWTQNEIDALVLMCRLISGHISQKQSVSLLHRNNQATRELLNNLPGSFVLVISKDTNELLYFNKKVKECFPAVYLGMKCHEIFKECGGSCQLCPRKQFAGEQAFSTVLHDMPFGKAVRLSVSETLWENREAAHVALLSEFEPSKKEKDLQKKKEAYVRALCSSYDHVIDIDTVTGQYELLALTSSSFNLLPAQGDFTIMHESFVCEHVHPEDRLAFYSRFQLASMIDAFTNGVQIIESELRVISYKQEASWKKSIAIPYYLDDGSFHILSYFCDITTAKIQELRRRDEEQSYVLALQGNYSEIFKLNIKTQRIAPLYYDSEQVAISLESADFCSFVWLRLEDRVHPDDFDATIDFYAPARVQMCVSKGESTEIEYRKIQPQQVGYRWMSATIRPVPDSHDNALLLLRDVTRNREEESTFYAALKSSYTEIYEIDLDADSVRLVSSKKKIHMLDTVLAFASYAENTQHLARTRVHPEDRDIFIALYDTNNLRTLDGHDNFVAEYRIYGNDRSYRWISVLVLPLQEMHTHKVLALCQDITEKKRMEQASHRFEQRYNAVFRQACSMIMEINLMTEAYKRAVFIANFPTLLERNKYSESFADFLESVHPEDREALRAARSIEGLRLALHNESVDNTCTFRLLQNGVCAWFSSQLFFVKEDEGYIAFVLGHDITARKTLEEERKREAQRFTLALRGTYTEIYELDMNTSVSTLLFNNSKLLLPVGMDNLVDTNMIIASAIHPEDREHVAEHFSSAALQARFEQGCTEIVEEFRRLGVDNDYHWVSALAVPMRDANGVSNKCMLLIKDISARKAQEWQQRINEQYNLALRNIYDELFECNVTQNKYRILYYVENKYVLPPQEGLLIEGLALVEQQMIHPDDRTRFNTFFDVEAIRDFFAKGQDFWLEEFRKLTVHGEYAWVSFTVFPLSHTDGDDEIYLVFIMDINAQKQSEEIAQQNNLLERQRLADERYRIIVEQTNTLVFEWIFEENTRYISPELGTRFAGTYDDRDIMHIWREDDVIHPDDLKLFDTFLVECKEKIHAEMTVRYRKRDGEFIWCKVVLSCQRDENGRPLRYIGTLNDVDAAICSATALQYRAEYDVLTGIYNMQTFYDRAEELLRRHPERQYCIIRLDIDRFKVINDLYGLEAGDRLLTTVARLIHERMTPLSVCGRISGDVFCMCVDFSYEHIIYFVQEMNDKLAQYPLNSRVVSSFGICRVDSVDTPINSLCDWAHLALKTIKGNVLINYAFYDEQLRQGILEEKKIENEMHHALGRNEFQLFLQPKVHIPTGRIVGAEGLVRWMHPVDGMIMPDRFIPLFEKNGFIIRLDEYIWEQACKQLRCWLDRGLEPTPMSINVSRMHIYDTSLCDKLRALMEKYDLSPHLLELELTESVFLDSESRLFSTIRTLHDYGFVCSLDDFGSGYSSLNMLKSLLIKEIKIDRGFLNEVVATERGKTVIRHTISLAKELNIQVIAEGVENIDHATFLVSAGCERAQGFYYSPPVTLEVFERLAFGNACPFPATRVDSF